MIRRKYKADRNEAEIVSFLRQIPGVSVETGHDDIIVGFRGRNFWYEIKHPDEVDKDGRPYAKSSKTAKKQKKLLDEFDGHYSIVTTVDEILTEIGAIA